ncbi:MAG: hypothetical protein PHW09_03460 [Desulfovibrio desulfuricans]|nr:hypothetical protein [Desulfovibrio desulfuricans]
MSKCVQKKRLSADKIASIFEGLSRLMPSNRPSTREVLESQRAVILAAIARGNSLRDIVNFLTKKGLNVSHESLRKIVLLWQGGVASGVKPESKKAEDIQNVEGGVAVKNGTISRQVMGCSVSKSGAVKSDGTSQAAVNKDQSCVPKDNQNREVDDSSKVSNLQEAQRQIQGSERVNLDATALSNRGVVKSDGTSQSAVKDGQACASKSNQNNEVNGRCHVSNLQEPQSQIQAAERVNHEDSVLSTDAQNGVSGKVKEAVIPEKKNLAFLNSDSLCFNNKDKIKKAAFDVEPDKEKY